MRSSYVLRYIGQERSKPYSTGDVVVVFNRENGYVVDIEKSVRKTVHNLKEIEIVTKRIYVHLLTNDDCIPYLDKDSLQSFFLEVRNDMLISGINQRFSDEIQQLVINGNHQLAKLKSNREQERTKVADEVDRQINEAMNEWDTNKYQYQNVNEVLEAEASETKKIELEDRKTKLQGSLSASEKKFKSLNSQRNKRVASALVEIDQKIADCEIDNAKVIADKQQEQEQLLHQATEMFVKTQDNDLATLNQVWEFSQTKSEKPKKEGTAK